MRRRRGDAGFTLVELMVTMAVMVPILLVATSTIDAIGTSTNANSQNAEVVQQNRAITERLRKLLRPAVLSSFRVRASPADVADYQGRAAAALLLNPLAVTYVPHLGDWISPPSPMTPRSNLQFQCASGHLSMNAEALTPVRELQFVLDPHEIANGIDDDGDGMVDEGQLQFFYEGTRVFLADNVEHCSFEFNGRVVEVHLGLARRDGEGRVYRATFVHSFLPRNS